MERSPGLLPPEIAFSAALDRPIIGGAEPDHGLAPAVALAPEKSRRGERLRSLARKRAESSRRGLFTLMFMADWAIRLAVRSEPNHRVRRERRQLLLDRWRRYSGNLMLHA